MSYACFWSLDQWHSAIQVTGAFLGNFGSTELWTYKDNSPLSGF